MGEGSAGRRPVSESPAGRRPASESLIDRGPSERGSSNREGDERRRARAEARARYRAAQKKKRLIIISAFALLLLIIIVTIVRCASGNEDANGNGNGNDAETNGVYNENEDMNGGEEAPPAEQPNQNMQEVYNQDGVVIYFISFEDDFLGTSAVFYVRNDGDTPVTVKSADVSVNGSMISGVMSDDIMPGETKNTAVMLLETDLEANGIETVDTMDIRFVIRDIYTWDIIQQSDLITIRD